MTGRRVGGRAREEEEEEEEEEDTERGPRTAKREQLRAFAGALAPKTERQSNIYQKICEKPRNPREIYEHLPKDL